jgi:hypothetical protein
MTIDLEITQSVMVIIMGNITSKDGMGHANGPCKKLINKITCCNI